MYMYIYIHTHKKSPPLVSGDYNDRYTVDERISQGKNMPGQCRLVFIDGPHYSHVFVAGYQHMFDAKPRRASSCFK